MHSGQEDGATFAVEGSFRGMRIAAGALETAGPEASFSSLGSLFCEDRFSSALFSVSTDQSSNKSGLGLDLSLTTPRGRVLRMEALAKDGGDLMAVTRLPLLSGIHINGLLARVGLSERAVEGWFSTRPPLPDCEATCGIIGIAVERLGSHATVTFGTSLPESRPKASAGSISIAYAASKLWLKTGAELVEEGFVTPRGIEAWGRARAGLSLRISIAKGATLSSDITCAAVTKEVVSLDYAVDSELTMERDKATVSLCCDTAITPGEGATISISSRYRGYGTVRTRGEFGLSIDTDEDTPFTKTYGSFTRIGVTIDLSGRIMASDLDQGNGDLSATARIAWKGSFGRIAIHGEIDGGIPFSVDGYSIGIDWHLQAKDRVGNPVTHSGSTAPLDTCTQ